MNIAELQKSIAEIYEIWHYITYERFVKICSNVGFDKEGIRTQYNNFQRGIFIFIKEAPEILIESLLAYKKVIDITNSHFVLGSTSEWVKFIYVKHGKAITEEIDLMSYEGVLAAKKIYENSEEILGKLRLCDEIDSQKTGDRKEKIKIYENDFLHVNDSWKKPRVVVALMNTSKSPYYVELIYTDKYGYLNSKGNINKDEEVTLDKGILNTTGRKMNSYAITMGDNWRVMGNLLTDMNLLKPDRDGADSK